jgi:anti-sigma B factor antagonist
MDNSSAKLLVAVFDRTVCVQINGRADFTSSVDLKKLIDELWAHGYSHFIFDLCQCRTMDSTFLGMLSGISMELHAGQNGHQPLELFNLNPRLAETLDSLGVADLFKISETSAPLTDKYEPLAKSEGSTRLELARTCLEAHKTLMSVKPENEQKFKDVAQFLAEDLKRLELSDQK